MTLIMRDSTDPFAIPVDTPVVAGYGDGLFQWSSAGWARFPNSIPLSIVCFPGSVGDILDIETGCASPADAPGWCDRFSRPGRRAPTLYVNRSNWDAVRAAVGSRQVDYWVATLDGTQDVPGAVAVQYIDTGAYDESVILDPTWVGIFPPPPPVIPEEVMVIRNPADGSVYVVSASGKRHLAGLEYGAWKQTPGYAEISVDAATVAEIPNVGMAPVDVNALAAALAPLLPPETDPAVIAKATVDAIKAQWAK